MVNYESKQTNNKHTKKTRKTKTTNRRQDKIDTRY